VFRYQKSQPFLTYLNDMRTSDVKHYMWCMLKAVEHLANNGIMHRDIKPSNFLYDMNTKTGLLIDFGLSELELNANSKPVKNEENENVKKIAQL
jgi:cell division control protein 7